MGSTPIGEAGLSVIAPQLLLEEGGGPSFNMPEAQSNLTIFKDTKSRQSRLSEHHFGPGVQDLTLRGLPWPS